MRGHNALIPLFTLLDKSDNWIEIARKRTHTLISALKTKSCAQGAADTPTPQNTIEPLMLDLPASLDGRTRTIVELVDKGVSQLGARPTALRSQFRIQTSIRPQSRPASVDSSFCALVTSDGRVYGCGSSGAPYDGQFESGANNPQMDVRPPLVHQTLALHRASGIAFSRSRQATDMAFPTSSWRHTEPPRVVVLALAPGAWGRASFFAFYPLGRG
jgi:hypothetical protein